MSAMFDNVAKNACAATTRNKAIPPAMRAANTKTERIWSSVTAAPIAAKNLTSPAPIPFNRYNGSSRAPPTSNPAPLDLKPAQPLDHECQDSDNTIVAATSQFGIRRQR